MRTFRLKNPSKEFFCPLCSTKRAFTISPRLTQKNYFQIVMMSVFFAMVLYPFMEWRGVFAFFPIWVSFEATIRILFRKEIPCPHCGFDASWYKRDIKVARRIVKEFWASRGVVTDDQSLDEAMDQVDSMLSSTNA